MAKKELRLEFTDYVVKGEVLVDFWGGAKGNCFIRHYHVSTLNMEEILAGINDGGFGCKRIFAAKLDIYENYEGYLVHNSSIEIDIPPNCGKRGI